MRRAIQYLHCRHCGKPHERDGETFDPPRFCASCTDERRGIAASAHGSRPIGKREMESGVYILPMRASA